MPRELQGVRLASLETDQVALSCEVKSVNLELHVNEHISKTHNKASIVLGERNSQHSSFLRILCFLNNAVQIWNLSWNKAILFLPWCLLYCENSWFIIIVSVLLSSVDILRSIEQGHELSSNSYAHFWVTSLSSGFSQYFLTARH